jgi:hypothetical protein
VRLALCGSTLLASGPVWLPGAPRSLDWQGHACDGGRVHFCLESRIGGPLSPATPVAGPESGDMRSLVLRAWLEAGVRPRLRVRVVEIAPGRGERSVVATSSVDEACGAVRSWLEALQTRGANENGDGAVTRGG